MSKLVSSLLGRLNVDGASRREEVTSLLLERPAGGGPVHLLEGSGPPAGGGPVHLQGGPVHLQTAQSGGAKAAKRAPPPPVADMTEVASSSEEEVFDNPQGAGSGSSTLTPLLAGSSSGQRSKPIRIAKNGARGGACSSPPSSSIPNPFPELEKSPPLASSLPPPATNKHLVKVYGEDSHSRSVWVSRGATAREVCHLLVQAAHCSDQENWALLELHPTLGLERCLEDHEVLLEVQSTWSLKGDTRFAFCKNYAKYEFFRKPTLFFPENMISDSADETKGMTSSDLIQELLKSGTCPEIQGFLQAKEPSRKSWKKVYFFLRRSGLYCSTKGCSKEPRHLQYVADLDDLNVYTVVNSRKLYSSPSEFTFCIKGSRNPLRVQDLKLLCGDSEQTRTCWTSAFRLFKYGKQLQSNYQVSSAAPKNPEKAQRAEARAESSMVAMDFTGKDGGRVIDNPTEAESAEREEGQAWRRREALRGSTSTTGPQLSMIHKTQQWFHGGVSRKDTQRLIEKQGLVDGLFMVRDSQQHVSCFVLSLCFKLKTKHYLVIPCDDDNKKYVTMDDGVTLFIDLLQLVEFHQINRGILPVCLKHPCVCVAMVGTAPSEAPCDPGPSGAACDPGPSGAACDPAP